MTKSLVVVEHIIVTFFEAAVAYVSINQTNLSGSAKWVAIGALGAGISAVYNVLRQSNPTLPAVPVDPVPPVVVTPAADVVPPVTPL